MHMLETEGTVPNKNDLVDTSDFAGSTVEPDFAQ